MLSGKKKDDAMLADPRIRSILQRSMDVVLCRAITADSDEFCSLIPEQKDELPDTPLDFPRAAHESNRALVHVPGRQVRDLSRAAARLDL